MIKKIILIYFLVLSYSLLESKDVYGLKESYDIIVKIDGSDKASIEAGMREALETLMIKMTGSTDVALDKKFDNLYRNAEQYINQYKLSSSGEVLNAKFFFEGHNLRNFLSDNQLPLLLTQESIVMAYLPCELQSSVNVLDASEIELCGVLKDKLSIISQNRNVELAYPILDFRDLNYLDSFRSVSYSAFMNSITKRYGLDNWLICFIRDDFGVILQTVECISSISDEPNGLEETFNNFINKINAKKSLVVNKKMSSKSTISIEGVSDYLTLEKVTEELRSQIIVTDLNLLSINKSSIDYELSSYGKKEDLENLLNINSNFIQSDNSSRNKLIYKYIET